MPIFYKKMRIAANVHKKGNCILLIASAQNEVHQSDRPRPSDKELIMTTRDTSRVALTVLACLYSLQTFNTFAAEIPASKSESRWTRLFNGNSLDGWYIFLQKSGRDSDPDNVISVEDEMIHAYKHAVNGSEVVMGYIGTKESYSNYHLRLKYKWGQKQFKPRYQYKPDAGIYYHHVGDDLVWPQALQFQVELNGVRDLLTVGGIQVDTTIDPARRTEEWQSFLPARLGGVDYTTLGKGVTYTRKLKNAEHDGWNTVDLICKGDASAQIVNGTLVNQCSKIRQIDPNNPASSTPLNGGRILLEFEATEMFYRDIELRPIGDDESLEQAIAMATEVPPTQSKVQKVSTDGVRVGAASVELISDPDMIIGGGITGGTVPDQEGKLRVIAVVLEKPGVPKCAIVAADVLFISSDFVDPALSEISRTCGILPENILVNATHTHHAPTTATVHGYQREERFCERVKEGIVKAVTEANQKLSSEPCEFRFSLGEESSYGQNSRILLSDQTIYWIGNMEDEVRPTGPFDPELPVLAFLNRGQKYQAVIFNHSTHTIGTRKPNVKSPSAYGLATQELEEELGGTFLFLEGASGSTHNMKLKCDEAVIRIKGAVKTALEELDPIPVDQLKSLKRSFQFHVRKFDEAVEDKKCVDYCKKRAPQAADVIIDVFRKQRALMAPHQGEPRTTTLQAMVIGDVAIVGVPAEYFTVLGKEIKRRSPFRYTYVAELANDWIGYLPDRRGHAMGGYQTWMGLHSYAEEGTGERIVDETISMLKDLQKK